MKTEEKEKEKNYSECCDHCLQQILIGVVHCWRRVNYRGQVGYIGCHEQFASSEAYWAHLHHGGCRNPVDIDTFRWNGVSWRLKEEGDEPPRRERG